MRGAIAALASAALLWAGTGLHPIWWLTWLAPLPVLWSVRRSSWWAAVIAAFASWLLGGLNMWGYLHGRIGLPAPVVVLLFAIPAGVFAIAVLLWRREVRRGRVWRAALLPPLVWVAYEYLNTIASPHSTFGNIAYSQMDCLPVLQVASLTGIWGIVFLLFLVPSTVAALFSTWNRTLAVALAVLLIAVTGFGEWRLHSDLRASGMVTVTLIDSDAPRDIFPSDDARALNLFRAYADQIHASAASHADVIVLPEKLARISEAASPVARGIFSATAASSRTELVAGLDEMRQGLRWNDALLFSPGGELEASYEKHHFIPVIEAGYVTGNSLAVLSRPSGTWGIIICKDLDFPALSRQYAQTGAGLLLAPAWDFTVDGWLHDRMAVMRGVESGFSIARAAKQGVLTLSDNRGRILLERVTSPSGFVIAQGRIPVAHAGTLYARAGDWFAWAALAALLAMIAVRGGRRADLAR
ncbi:MAG: nitrilase-related carbon-nitrogen hydrolase [Bryobacteraceae bacterium]|jgi:apolipoprotein N-acyltransferase